MIIKTIEKKPLKLRKFGKVWIADSVLGEIKEFKYPYELANFEKNELQDWFVALSSFPSEIIADYKVRLVRWEDIKDLPYKYKVANSYKDDDKIIDYWLRGELDNSLLSTYQAYNPVTGEMWVDKRIGEGKHAIRIVLERKE